jgi:hypothetical protein
VAQTNNSMPWSKINQMNNKYTDWPIIDTRPPWWEPIAHCRWNSKSKEYGGWLLAMRNLIIKSPT